MNETGKITRLRSNKLYKTDTFKEYKSNIDSILTLGTWQMVLYLKTLILLIGNTF